MSLLVSFFPFQLIQKIEENFDHTLNSCSENPSHILRSQCLYPRKVLTIGRTILYNALWIFFALVAVRNDFFIFSEKCMLWIRELYEPDLKKNIDLLCVLDGVQSDGAWRKTSLM